MKRQIIQEEPSPGLKVSGYSDDIVYVEGDLNEEFYPEMISDPDNDDLYMAFSDGTLLKVNYDEDGVWRFQLRFPGELFIEKTEGDIGTDTNDMVTFQPGVKWCVLGPKGVETALPKK